MSVKEQIPLSARILEFDKLIRARSYEEAVKVLEKMLQLIEGGQEGFGGSLVARNLMMEREATQFCSAVVAMLADPDFQMTSNAYRVFTNLKRALMQVFEISGYRGTDFLIELIGARRENGTLQFRQVDIPKLFAGLSVNALSPAMLGLLANQKPTLSWPLATAFLSEQVIWSQQAEVARSEILSWGDKWMDMDVSLATVRNLGPAYMGCSYAVAPHKHEIKKCMNHLVRRFLESRGITDADLPEQRRAVKKRPTLVVLAELYDSKHAMHRCYGPSIRSLKSSFKTIYMSNDGKCDKEIESMFDKVDTIKFNPAKPEEYINKVKSYRPDIVYFPSVGMRLMSIFASNVRMAPIQVMTFGHPATTLSSHMDYAILDQEQVGDPATVNETILCRSSRPRFEMRADAQRPKPIARPNAAKVYIAVPAWSRKVTPKFLDACRQIKEKASKPVEFWFFPNGTGALYQATARRIEEVLPAKVFPRAAYNQYLKWLNQCDIFLSTFPFGATNGIVDGMRQGLPVVNLTGPEVHEANDSHIVKRFTQPDWLTTNTVEEYIDAVVRLVDDGNLRAQITKGIIEDNPDSRLIAQDADGAHDFVTVMEAAYKFHEEIQAKGDKLWAYDDLCSMLERDAG